MVPPTVALLCSLHNITIAGTAVPFVYLSVTGRLYYVVHTV